MRELLLLLPSYIFYTSGHESMTSSDYFHLICCKSAENAAHSCAKNFRSKQRCLTGSVQHIKVVLNFIHHYVPSVVNRSAVMDLHRSRSCATLIQSLYDIFVHSLMLSVHIVLGLPRPLLPFILPSISNRCTPSPLIICPKYWHFLFLIVFNNDLLVFILSSTYMEE